MLGVGLVVAGVSVPVPPLLEPDMPPLDSVLEPEEPELPFSGMLLPLDVPDLPVSEPPPVMPAHALSSIAHARGIIHFVINHSCKDKKSGTRNTRYRRMHAYAEDRIRAIRKVLGSAYLIEFTQAKVPARFGKRAFACVCVECIDQRP